MSIHQKAAKGVLWSAIESLSRQVVSLLIFFVLARLLSPQAFGLVALASVFTAFIEIFLDQGFSQAIIQRQDLEPDHLDTAFWTNLGISSLLTLSGIAASSWVADLLHEPDAAPIIQFLSLSFLISAFSSVQQAILQRQFAFKALAVRSVTAIAAGGVVGVTMAVMGLGAWSLVGQRLANGIAQVMTLWWVSHWRPRFRVSRKHFQDLFAFGINVVGSNFLNFFNRRSDDLLIGYFLGSVALGYYTIAYRFLLSATSFLTYPFVSVAFSTFSRLQQDTQQICQSFYKFTQLAAFFSFPFFFGVAALAPQVVETLFGQQWQDSIPVLRILSFIGLLHSISFYNGAIFGAMGKPSWGLKIILLNTIANVIAFVVVVQWGIVAVAAAYTVRGYVLMPVSLILLRRLIHLEMLAYLKQLLPAFIGASLMTALLLAIQLLWGNMLNVQVLLLISIAAGVGVYLATVYLIAPKLMKQGLSTLGAMLPHIKSKASSP